jgi:hypothetical protein
MDNTIIIYTADHDEMTNAHGLRGKGSFAYHELNNVPQVITHPDYKGGARCGAVISHIDLIPMRNGISYLPVTKKAKVREGLPGHDLAPLFVDPGLTGYDEVHPAVLYAFNMFIYLDPQFIGETVKVRPAGQKPTVKPDVDNFRGAFRSIFDGRYRNTRHFTHKTTQSTANAGRDSKIQ